MTLLSLSVVAALAAPEASSWDDTLDAVTRGVVAIKMDIPRAFDGDGRSNSQATGFVIDDGWILTNRHVVTPGPVKSKAIFFDKEEVDLVPVYRDPVHDFGLYRYDPAQLRQMAPPHLPLSPEHARVGLEIRVVGNDGGDQLQILDGTLARLDREAPTYGSDFNDFNTFYYQAASATSGGSSGSPVVDVHGHVVAINAGGSGRTASSYYLPLDRVVRAVDLLKAGKEVPRGTMQTRMVLQTYDELARMGIQDEVIDGARAARPGSTGLLVAQEVLPGGPADGKLRIGDVVLEVNGERVFDHVVLEGALDAHVGEAIDLKVARRGEVEDVQVTPGDLHAITPSAFLEVGGAVLHPLSYHQARVMQAPVSGLSVADRGYVFEQAGLPAHAVIVEIDGAPVTTLEAAEAQLAAMGQGQHFTVRYYRRGRPTETFVASAQMDRRWFDQRTCRRDDTTGTWPCTESDVVTEDRHPAVVDVELEPVDDKRAARVANSLVRLDVSVPVEVGAVPSTRYNGVGLYVGDGLLLTDRDTVPEALVEVEVTVGGVARLPARVAALHPVHDVAVLAFDPSGLEQAGLLPAELRGPFEAGDDVWYVGLDGDEVLTEKGEIEGFEPLQLPAEGSPRFRETNLDVYSIDGFDEPGVLIDKKGRVGGLWASFSYQDGRDTKATWRGIPSDVLSDAVDLVDGQAEARTLSVELMALPMSAAVELGVPADRIQQLVDATIDRRQLLGIARRMPSLDAVLPGDLLLAIDGTTVTTFRDVDAAVRGRDEVTLTVFRNGTIEEVKVPTERLDPIDIDRVVLWNGVRVHMAHRAARMQGMPACPYISYFEGGSPARRGGLYAWRCIESVNGTPTPDLDALLAADAALSDDARVRVELLHLEGKRYVRTLEPHRAFFPTEDLRFVDGEWVRETR